MTDLADFLTDHGCFAKRHSGETLGDHLMNTYRILKAIGVPETVALAGGLHSIYGTNAFKNQTISDRDEVKAAFGPNVERLAYIFGRIQRPKALEEVPTTGGILKDRETDEPIHVYASEVWALRMIEAANLIEQGGDLSRFWLIAETMQSHLDDAALSQKMPLC